MGRSQKKNQFPPQRQQQRAPLITHHPSFLSQMVDGREYASLIEKQPKTNDVAAEIRLALNEISKIRKRPLVCYIANMVGNVNGGDISINQSDDQPFLEMLRNVDTTGKALDIIIETPGGISECVELYTNKIREKFDEVGFIVPHKAMSAGTIFCLSGDELIMDERACVGPIDPQVRTKDGSYLPAQSIITWLEDVKEKGEKAIASGKAPDWTDLQMLNKIDPKEVGVARTYSLYSTTLVAKNLANYKFKNWQTHTSNGLPVTQKEKEKRAQEIAEQLCTHKIWKTHSHGITRSILHQECKLLITHPEDTENLDRAIKRFWALIVYLFEQAPITKIYISDNYAVFRSQFHPKTDGGK